MKTQTRLVTAEEFSRMPDSDMRQELVAGQVCEAPPPKPEHGRVTMRLAARLAVFVEAHHLGEVWGECGFVLARDPDTVRGPDAAFVSRARLGSVPKDAYFPGAADLVVEVRSPGDRRGKIADKVAAYIEAGCRMVVVVNPKDRTVTVHRSATDVVVLKERDTFDGADVVPGFRLPVAALFAD